MFHNALGKHKTSRTFRAGGNRANSGHYRPTSETPFKWRFAGGPMMAHFYMVTVCVRGGGWGGMGVEARLVLSSMKK